MVTEFVIASHPPESDDPHEQLLYNLRIRLRLQKEYVARTEAEIANLEEIIKNKEK